MTARGHEWAFDGRSMWKSVFYGMTNTPGDFARLMGTLGPKWVENEVVKEFERVKRTITPADGQTMLSKWLVDSAKRSLDFSLYGAPNTGSLDRIKIDPDVHMIPRVGYIHLLGGHWTGYAYDKALDAVMKLLASRTLKYEGHCSVQLLLNSPVVPGSEDETVTIPALVGASSKAVGPSSITLDGLRFQQAADRPDVT